MSTVVDFLEKQEAKRIQTWKSFNGTFKHYSLMYVYRLKTDSENILDYVETFKFLMSPYSIDDLPDFITRMSPSELRYEAYEVIGKLGQLPQEPA